MNRYVGRIRDEATVRPKEGAREVEAFLYVGGDGGPLKDATHLLSDRHEPIYIYI